MIHECLNFFYKSHCVGQLCMVVECGFVLPAGMDVEQTRIADGTECVYEEATGFLPRRLQDFLDAGSNRIVPSFLRVEAGKDEQFRGHGALFIVNAYSFAPHHVKRINEPKNVR